MSKRRVDARGRTIANDSHARIYPWEYNSAAFQSLSCSAVRLLIELKMLHNGHNNGKLFLSVRQAAKRIHIGKNQVSQAFAELRDRGFIRPNVEGAFNLKSGARQGLATSWVLTEFPIGEAMGSGTKDFMRWKPTVPGAGTPKIIRRYPIRDGVCPERAHPVPGTGTPPAQLCPERAQFSPETALDGARSGHTVKLPGGGSSGGALEKHGVHGAAPRAAQTARAARLHPPATNGGRR